MIGWIRNGGNDTREIDSSEISDESILTKKEQNKNAKVKRKTDAKEVGFTSMSEKWFAFLKVIDLLDMK